jgi:hypothetical protein
VSKQFFFKPSDLATSLEKRRLPSISNLEPSNTLVPIRHPWLHLDATVSTAIVPATEERISSGDIQRSEYCTTFTCFPKLPIELRLKIWKEASSVPRRICVYIRVLAQPFEEDDSDGEDEDNDGEDDLTFTSFIYLATWPHLPVLRTSRESRIESLKHYKLAFGVEKKKRTRPSITLSSPANTYINGKADRICLSNTYVLKPADTNYFCDFVGLHKQHSLRSLTINVFELYYGPRGYHRSLFDALSDGSISLREILLFSAPYGIIEREVLKRRQAAIKFPRISAGTLERAQLRFGCFWNRGDIHWAEEGCLYGLESAEGGLSESFVKHERGLVESKSHVENAKVSPWTRPKVEWRFAKLKLLPGHTADDEIG